MNLWKVGFEDEDREIDVTLMIRTDTLDSALLITNEISGKRNLKLKFISQMWLDFRSEPKVRESEINAF